MDALRMRVVGLIALVAVLAAAPVSQARRTESLSLVVSFFANGSIAVALPDGSALGSTSGSPQIIPAGYYSLLFSGPGGCSALPYFHLNGPGVNIATDMNEGTQAKASTGANLEPSSTYTWSDDAFPGVAHTFTTSAVVEGSPPAQASPTGSGSSSGPGVSYPSIIGSDVAPSRGTLKAVLSSTGALTISYNGKQPASLRAGKYKVAVTDRSKRDRLTLKKPGHASLLITRSTSVSLTAGKWFFAVSGHRTSFTVVVH